jgi:hypothetical protein
MYSVFSNDNILSRLFDFMLQCVVSSLVCLILNRFANSLKQQSADRHVSLLGHIMLIPSQPVFALSPERCVVSEEAKI